MPKTALQLIKIALTPAQRAHLHNIRVWEKASKEAPFMFGVPESEWPAEMRLKRLAVWEKARAKMLPIPEEPAPPRYKGPFNGGPCD